MGIRIFKQPDGQYAVFSNTTESFLIEDATADEIHEWYVERQKQRAEREVENLIESADSGTYKSHLGPQSYEEAVEKID